MILYHGSTTDIVKIDLRMSKPNKDFGKGFYLSADRMQALKMAEYKAFQLGASPFVNEYDFDERLLSDGTLKVLEFKDYSKNWAEFVLANRMSNDGGSAHDYDVVVGPIADDRVGLQIRKYLDNIITLASFMEALKYMRGVTFQYFFGTGRAINCLRKR